MTTLMTSKVRYLLTILGPDILARTSFKKYPQNINTITFFDRQTSLHSGNLYLLTDASQAERLETLMIFPGAIAVICEGEGAVSLLQGEKRDFIGLAVRGDFISIYNRLNAMMMQYQNWRNHLFNVRLDRFSLEGILQTAQEKFERKIYFVDREYHFIYGYENADENFRMKYRQILKQDPLETVGAKAPDGVYDQCEIYGDDSGKRYFCTWISIHSYPGGCVIIEGKEEETADLPTLALLLGRSIYVRLGESVVVPLDYQRAFERLLENIMSGRLTEEKDFINEFKMLPHPVKNQIRCVVVCFESSSLNDKLHLQLFSALRNAFPDANLAVFRDEIVLLLSYEETPVGLEEETRRRLDEILEKFNASAGVGEPFHRFGHFKTQYSLVRKLLRIGMTVRFQPEERIFTRGEYIHYLIIDLALKNFVQEYEHYNFAYLIHPAIVKLSHYDAKHQTDLLKLLHIYLVNNQSAGRTADWVFMHRNTVLNKMKKISAITSCDLNNPTIQHQFLISCCLMRYSERYLHRDLLESDFIFRNQNANGENT